MKKASVATLLILLLWALTVLFTGARNVLGQTENKPGLRPILGQHWVETWGVAQTPARIPPPSPNLMLGAAGRGTQAALPPTASTQAPAPTPAPQAAAPTPSNPAPPIPIAPQVAPPSSVVQRRYNLPRAVSSFNNQTLRMILRTSIGGDTIRVSLYNAFGARAVMIGAAHVALHAKDSAIAPGSDRTLTFGGRPTATMYSGQLLVSDPVKLTVAPLADLAVSLYFPDDTGAPTTHALGLQPAYTSGPGDFTGAAEIADPASVTYSYYWLEGVDVLAPADAAAIVTFGDSITDGDQSMPGAYAMWPAVLAARLHGDPDTPHVAVVNEGISGNRTLGDNVSGLVRFAHQALDVPGVKWITLLEGINDISGATRANAPDTHFSADDLIAAYKEMIDEAHSRGVKVIGCTLTPFGGSSVYKDAGEAIREAANDWIRAPGHFDAVVDFDKATRDANDPTKFSPAAESPDLLHPGDAGYKMMAGAFDLKVFATSSAVPNSKGKYVPTSH